LLAAADCRDENKYEHKKSFFHDPSTLKSSVATDDTEGSSVKARVEVKFFSTSAKPWPAPSIRIALKSLFAIPGLMFFWITVYDLMNEQQ
jgi:hypothetical protein